MKKVYVINNLVGGGYFDDVSNRFRGILFATRYNSKEEADTICYNKHNDDFLQVIEIFVKN